MTWTVKNVNIITRNAMIKARLKIEDGEIYDITEKYGLVYINGDKRFAAPIKDFEETIYPEQSGKNINPRTTDDAFEYKVVFFIKTDSITRANKKISRFNSSLYTQEGDVKTFKQVTFYDDYKGVKIVGYPKPMADATEFWRDKNKNIADIVCCEWVVCVNNPSLCDFNDSDVYVAGDAVVIDGDMLANGNIVAGVEVYIKDKNLIFQEI